MSIARRAAAVAGGLLAAVLLGACGSSGTGGRTSAPVAPTTAPTPQSSRAGQPAVGAPSSGSPLSGSSGNLAAAASITIHDFAYKVPSSVAPGAKVTVKNTDQIAHTVTADKGSSVFNVNVDPGSSGTFTAPSKPGSYRFHCVYHSNMHGTLVVK